MAIVQRFATKRSFINGRLVKRGEAILVDDGKAGDNFVAPAAAIEAVAPKADAVDLMADDNDALVEGTLAKILPTLSDKSVDELKALAAAEADREVPRSTLTKAIDKELAARAE